MQFVHERHREATSSHRGCSRLRASSAGSPSACTVRPMRSIASAVDRVRGAHLVVGRLARMQLVEQLGAGGCADVDREPVVELGEREVEPARAPWSGAHRRAEAGGARQLAVDPDGERALAARPVGRVSHHEHPVLHVDRRQVAGPQPDERVPHIGQGCRRHIDPSVVTPMRRLDRLARREQEALARVGPVRPAEQVRVVGVRQPVGPGRVLLAHTAGQIVGSVDLVEHDRAVAHGGPDQRVPLLAERPQHRCESIPIQVSHRLHPCRRPLAVGSILARRPPRATRRMALPEGAGCPQSGRSRSSMSPSSRALLTAKSR